MLLELGTARGRHVDAVDDEGAGARRLDHGDDARQRRFAAAGFADDGEGLSGFEREADAVDGAELQRLGEGSATEAVVAAEILGPHDERLGHHATAGSGLGWPTGRPWVSG